MPALKMHRVNSLPSPVEANSIYYVDIGNSQLEVYVVGNSVLDVKRIPNLEDIGLEIADQLANFQKMEVVTDIAARDLLSPSSNTYALVLDATADSTVSSGAATYVYSADSETWTKVSEAESMDVILDWSNIQNGPNSSVNQIDDAVAQAHSHMNQGVLDLLGEDVDGNLTYNGVAVGSQWATTSW